MFFAGFSGATAFFPDKVRIACTCHRRSDRFSVVGWSGGDWSQFATRKVHRLYKCLTLSHRQNMFSLEFAALSYLNPATNRYRYKLEGLDSAWHEVGSEQRLVNYTTLPAGVYTFRVQGATNSGPWTEPGVTLRIEVLPPWWSTWWFRTTCAVLLVLLAFAAYSYHLHQIGREFELLLEGRIDERTRIARELHDTLLQSFQGLLFTLQAVHDLLPGRPAEAIQLLDQVLDRGDQAIAEGRDAVQGLRSSTIVDSDLIHRLTVLAEELCRSQREPRFAEFPVVGGGTAATLGPDSPG